MENQQDQPQAKSDFKDFYLAEDLKAIKELEEWFAKEKKYTRRFLFSDSSAMETAKKLLALIQISLIQEKEFFDGQHPNYKRLHSRRSKDAGKSGKCARTLFKVNARVKQEVVGNTQGQADPDCSQDEQREVSTSVTDSMGFGETEQEGFVPIT
jgi:hypothetical protein